MSSTAQATFDPSAYERGRKLWLPDTGEAWVGCEVYDRSTEQLTVKTDRGEFLVIKSLGARGIQITDEDGARKRVHKVFELPQRNPAFLEGLDDLTALSYLHEPGILHNLRLRHRDDEMYTWTGPILIAVNPWKELPLYGEDMIDLFRSARPNAAMRPHVYAVAEAAYRNLLKHRQSQSILVSGDSGAGKTESCKIIANYLAYVSSLRGAKAAADAGGSAAAGAAAGGRGVEQLVLDANPILEAFGNAKTLMNDNSSRFGRYTEILFRAGRIAGARIRTYLLEKHRVARHRRGERSFHVFYQLCHGADDELRTALQLGDHDEYHFLADGDATADGDEDAAVEAALARPMEDSLDFAATCAALNGIGVDRTERLDLFRACAGLLHLGNIQFAAAADAADAATVDNGAAALAAAAHLLGVDKERLATALTSRTMHVGEGTIARPLSPDAAADARDALAKALYARIFDWTVDRINRTLTNSGGAHSTAKGDHASIGLLDIFGFEKFAHNGFEQFCINYANEKLQFLFNSHVFSQEQKEYEREGIQWEFIDFRDNRGVITLVDAVPAPDRTGPPGLIALLDEECNMPSGSAKSFATRAIDLHAAHKHIERHRFAEDGFVIHHYAGEVAYDASGFLDRNRDPLHADLVPVVQASTAPFVASLFPRSMLHRKAGARRGQALHSASVAAQFRDQLSALVAELSATHPHFVRCINSNLTRLADRFCGAEVAHQLRCGGVIEAVRITRDMYPSRIDHLAFYDRFTSSHEWRCLLTRRAPDTLRTAWPPLPPAATIDDVRAACARLATALDLRDPQDYQLGRSRVFCRAGLLARLDTRVSDYVAACATRIRAVWLARRDRRHFQAARAAALRMETAARGFLARQRVLAIRRERAAAVIQRCFRHMMRVQGFRSIVYLMRKQALAEKRRREAEERRNAAAALIKRRLRGWVARAHFVRARRAAIKIQARRRGLLARRAHAIQKGARLYDRLADLEQRNSDLGAALEAASTERDALRTAVADLERTLEETRETMKKDADEQFQAVLADLEDTERRLADESARARRLDAERAELTKRTAGLEEKVAHAMALHASQQRASAAAQGEIRRLKALLDATSTDGIGAAAAASASAVASSAAAPRKTSLIEVQRPRTSVASAAEANRARPPLSPFSSLGSFRVDRVQDLQSTESKGVFHAGYLTKEKNSFAGGAWNRRYFVCKGNKFYYFEKEEDFRSQKRPKHTVDLAHSAVQRLTDADKLPKKPPKSLKAQSCGFRLVDMTTSASRYFFAADDDDCAQWIRVLETACSINQYLQVAAAGSGRDDRVLRFLANPSATALSLDNHETPTEAVITLTKVLKEHDRLAVMSLCSCALTDSHIQLLGDFLLSSSSIKCIRLRNNDLTQKSAAVLAKVSSQNTSVNEIALDGNRIGDKGASYFASALGANNTLAVLSLAQNGIGAEGCVALCDALQQARTISKISTLALRGNRIGDRGARAVAELLRHNTHVSTIDLADNHIFDEGMEELARVLNESDSIMTASLGHNPLSAHAAKSLLSILENNISVLRLDLSGLPLGGAALGACLSRVGEMEEIVLHACDIERGASADVEADNVLSGEDATASLSGAASSAPALSSSSHAPPAQAEVAGRRRSDAFLPPIPEVGSAS